MQHSRRVSCSAISRCNIKLNHATCDVTRDKYDESPGSTPKLYYFSRSLTFHTCARFFSLSPLDFSPGREALFQLCLSKLSFTLAISLMKVQNYKLYNRLWIVATVLIKMANRLINTKLQARTFVYCFYQRKRRKKPRRRRTLRNNISFSILRASRYDVKNCSSTSNICSGNKAERRVFFY